MHHLQSGPVKPIERGVAPCRCHSAENRSKASQLILGDQARPRSSKVVAVVSSRVDCKHAFTHPCTLCLCLQVEEMLDLTSITDLITLKGIDNMKLVRQTPGPVSICSTCALLSAGCVMLCSVLE
jgi:hypothetical protein